MTGDSNPKYGNQENGNHENGNQENWQEQMVPEDLLATALRYVLEEMPSFERAEFECRLVERQDAREAVADAVALCQFGKQAIDHVMEDTEARANWRPAEFIEPVRPASQLDRLWRAPATWAAMIVAASIVVAVVLTGVRSGNQFEHKPIAGAPDTASADTNASDADNSAGRRADQGKQLAVAWLNFLPSPNGTALAVDATEIEDDALGVEEDNNALAGDEDIMAFSDSGTTGSDWLFQAVTAPAAQPSTKATTNAQEG